MSTSLASRYVIRRKLGEGGMAEVLEAVAQGDAGFTRRVAIKRLRSGHEEDPSFSRMFLDEARIASRLHHGAIVGVLDYGVVDGTPFQILEFVDGENARVLATRGSERGTPMPLEVALYLTTEIARALHYAHTFRDEDGTPRSVVHRDVKPANILVSRTGDVKLADFGIAFAFERTERTRAGVAKGTPGYMSPEQHIGGAVDARADVFALGCTLHALAFSDSPLARDGNAERLLRGEPLEISPDVPDDVARIIRRAIDPLPSKRHPTAAALADELGAVLAVRLRSDPKGALLQWLEAIREDEPATSALDALLMPEALLEQEGGSWRLEETRHEEPLPSPPTPAPPRSRAPILGAIIVGAIAIGAIGMGVTRKDPNATPRATSTLPAPTTVPTPSETVASALPTSSSPLAPPDTTHAIVIAALRPHASSTTTTASTAQGSESNMAGTLAIRGGAYRGATVVIDGRIEPFGAPHYFDLPIGKHTIELRADGGVVSSGTVVVEPQHTTTAPLYFP